MSRLRIVFMGTADLAATVLDTLVGDQAYEVIAAVSQPDKPKGRDLKLQPTPVKQVAAKHRIPVLQPTKAREPEFLQQLRELRPELIIVAAYGQILPQTLLDIPIHGCLNVHTSILPKYRGAAPIQWAILNGDRETGVTIMKMDAGLDTGPILTTERTEILASDNAQTLHDRLAQIGGALLRRTILPYIAGQIVPVPQNAEGVSYARKIAKEDGRIDWAQPAVAVWNKVRGLTPWPGAFTRLQRSDAPLLLKIWRAEPINSQTEGSPGTILRAGKEGLVVACAEGALSLLEVQREGGKRISAQQFLAGCPISQGETLGG